jgi:hypothetical protein
MQLGFRLGLVCSSISATVSSFMVGKADALPLDKHRRDSLAEFAEFDRICIFLAAIFWSG